MRPIPDTMTAVQLVGHDGPDMLVLSHEVPVPVPDEREVLIRVGACGMNNFQKRYDGAAASENRSGKILCSTIRKIANGDEWATPARLISTDPRRHSSSVG